MKDSKLIEILKSLRSEDFKELEKFTSSPYFTVGRDLTPFLKILKSFYPDFDHQNLNHEYIFAKLYPDKKKNKVQQTMKTLSSDLIKACKEFFKYSEFREDLNMGSYYLTNQLRKRKLYKDFEKEYKAAIEQQKILNKGGIIDFIDGYYLSSVFRDYSLDRNDFENSFEYTLLSDEYISAAALMVSFMFEDIKNISEGYNLPLRYTLMNNLLENLDCDKVMEDMKINNDRHYIHTLIYFMIYKMNKEKDKREYFFKLKDLLIEHQNLFGQSENYVFWNILLSYCSVNKLKNEILWIHRHILDNNIYRKSDEEDFHIILFRNIVTDNSYAGNYEWLKDFIEKYSTELHSDHRENMYNFSKAHLYFAKGEYEKALVHTGKINYDIFIFKLDARVLLLEIYFELGYYDQAFSLVDSTLHFLNYTRELSEYHKERYKGFIKAYNEILKIKSSGLKNRMDGKIITGKLTIQQSWIQKKIAELER